MLIPRDYQIYAINKLFEYFHRKNGNPVVAMPTGSGKGLVLAAFIQRAMQNYPNQRIIKLTHVKELIEQNLNELVTLWPSAPAGVYSAGLGRKDTEFPITFAGIATAYKNPAIFGHIDLVIIDECHLVSPRQGTMYQAFIQALKTVNPALKVIGFTATHYRMGQGLLIDGSESLFTDVCVDMTTLESFTWFIQEGYFSPLVPRCTEMQLNVEKVDIHKGEYNQKQLQEAVDQDVITRQALKEALRLGQNRKHWLVFTIGIKHSEHVAQSLNAMGVPATLVHSRMPNHERDKKILDFKAGYYQAMVNTGILTTGFNFPAIDLIVVLRPTRSPGLWVQLLGRGSRPIYAEGFDLTTREGRLSAINASSKRNCLVLDFAGNTPRLGPINDPMLPKRKKKGAPGDAPVKLCNTCKTYCHARARECPECGYLFPLPVNIDNYASTAQLIANYHSNPEVVSFAIDRITYSLHQRQDRPPSLKVSYFCGLRLFNEWVCLEHNGYPRTKARAWWRQRTNNSTPPETIAVALQQLEKLQIPIKIRVWVNKKYPEIIGYQFEKRHAEIGIACD